MNAVKSMRSWSMIKREGRSRFDRRGLGVAGAAVTAGAVAAADADAEIIWSGEINQVLTFANSGEYDLAIPNFQGKQVGFFAFNNPLLGLNSMESVSDASGNQPLPLAAGVQVQSSSTFTSDNYLYGTSGGESGRWQAGDRAYLGFGVDVTGGKTYGWADVSVAGDGATATIHSWAYESAVNTGITTGAAPVPEPQGLALAAAVLMGTTHLLGRWVRRTGSHAPVVTAN